MEKSLNEQLVRQLSLINYDRAKTLNEQLIGPESFINIFSEILNEENTSKTLTDNEKAIEYVKSLGSPNSITYNNTMSMNQVYAWYAINSIHLLTKYMINKNNIGISDCFSLKINGFSNAPKKFSLDSYSIDDTFKLKLLKYISSSDIQEKKQRTIGNTIFLEDFYYNWPKIVDDFNTAYKNDVNAYNSKLFPDGWFNFMNYWFGTTNYTLASAKINLLTTAASCEGSMLVSAKKDDYIDTPDEVVKVIHSTLEVFSVIASMFPGIGGWAASAAFDLIDASLYMWWDKDPWYAGLMVCFAIIPADVIFRVLPSLLGFTKKTLKEFFEKILNKGAYKLLGSERALLKELGSRLFYREAYIVLIKSTINKYLSKIYLLGVIKLFKWLIKNGYLLLSFPFKLGLYIAGVWVTWAQIAEKLGIKQLGEDVVKDGVKAVSDDLKPIIIEGLNDSVKNNQTYSEKTFKNYFSLNVFYIQLFLYYGDYDNYTKNIETNKLSNDELNVLYKTKEKENETLITKFKFDTIYKKGGNMWIKFIQKFKPKGGQLTAGAKIKITNSVVNGTWVIDKVEFGSNNEIDQISIKRTYKDEYSYVLGMQVRNYDNDAFTKKLYPHCGAKVLCKLSGDLELFYVVPPPDIENVISYDDLQKQQTKIEQLKFKWGYYDEQTTKAIKNFQFKEGLSIDGVVGSKATLPKILKLLNGNFPKIKNISNISDIDIEREINKTLVAGLTIQTDTKAIPPIIEIEIVYEEQKETVVKEQLQEEIDSMMRSVPEWDELKILQAPEAIQQFQGNQ
jgi:hypothetical protein